MTTISRFDMSFAQAHWVGSKSILRVMQLKLHKPTMAIGYSLRMCAKHVDSTNPGRSNLVFRSKLTPEVEMSNRLIQIQLFTFGNVWLTLTLFVIILLQFIYTHYGRVEQKYKKSARVRV